VNDPYRTPLFFKWPHINTIYPNIFRHVKLNKPHRERIGTPDNDFLDLDWYHQGAGTLVIISHGLEGNSERQYILGMVQAVLRAGWDALAWNFRGCSGEINKQPYFYHSGFTTDLNTIVRHTAAEQQYEKIALVGSSMGGNLTLKYLGEAVYKPHPVELQAAVAYSVPTDLHSSSIKLAARQNKIYMRRFLKKLEKKIIQKSRLYPELVSAEGYQDIKNFKDFDDRYTAPLNGFANAEDYWRQSSSKQFIQHIEIPTLIFNAADDPFLTPECHPVAESKANPHCRLEVTRYGGHVGFVQLNEYNEYWSEWRAINFLKHVLESGSQETILKGGPIQAIGNKY